MKLARSIGAIAAASALALTMVACSSDSDDSARPNDQVEAPTNGTAGDNPTNETGSGDDEGRAFGADRDMVIEAIETATGGSAGWEGDALVVTFAEGSAEAPTAGISCLAVETLIADDEDAVLRYPDGDLRCADRPGA